MSKLHNNQLTVNQQISSIYIWLHIMYSYSYLVVMRLFKCCYPSAVATYVANRDVPISKLADILISI